MSPGVLGLHSGTGGPGAPDRDLFLFCSQVVFKSQTNRETRSKGVKDDSIIRSAEGIVGRVRWVERGEEGGSNDD